MLLCPIHRGSYHLGASLPLSCYPELYLFAKIRQGYCSPLSGDRSTKGNHHPHPTSFTMTDGNWCINTPAPSTLSSVTHKLQCATSLQYALLHFPQLFHRIKFQFNFRSNRLNNVSLPRFTTSFCYCISSTNVVLVNWCSKHKEKTTTTKKQKQP